MNRRGPRRAEQRLRRLLVMLPWLMEQGEVPLAEVAERFDMSEQDVASDLELAAMCGLPPFVDELIDVFIDEGTVYVGVPRLFTRPLRLNSMEAVELLAAARTAMELPGADVEGPLGRGLRKLASAVGEDETGVLSIDLARPRFLDELVAAVDAHRKVTIQYWSASSDATTSRTILPLQVYSDRGAWYVTADDDRSGEQRTFRVDRIEDLQETDQVVAPTSTPATVPGRWFADGSVPRATLRFDSNARGVIERFPVDEVGEPDADGYMTAVVPVVNQQWLETTLLRLGTDAEVVEPAEWVGLRARTAQRLAARYAD